MHKAVRVVSRVLQTIEVAGVDFQRSARSRTSNQRNLVDLCNRKVDKRGGVLEVANLVRAIGKKVLGVFDHDLVGLP